MGSCLGAIRRYGVIHLAQPEAGKDSSSTDLSQEYTSLPSPLDVTSRDVLSTTFEPISLTMPHFSPGKPPRPEFTPFTVPYLCCSNLYDGKGFWTFPERCGWVIHAKDTNCHVLCPPGVCHNGKSYDDIRDERMQTQPSTLSRADGAPVLPGDKCAFLQAWLFFGLLMEVSALCGLEIDVVAEFTDGKGSVSTTKLNGLPQRWYMAAMKNNSVGDKALMEQLLGYVRHVVLMLTIDIRLNYTYSECRVLHSLDITARIIALHLLLHIYTPGFTSTEEEGWTRNRVSSSVDWLARGVEGSKELSSLARKDLKDRGWCSSELGVLAPDDLAFASLLPRPNIRDHSNCGDVICNAYQTDEATYVTRHVEDGCYCNFVGVQTNVLTDALSNGNVPKLVITDKMELRVVVEDAYPYIAISHVWADGLGNRTANALPRCQLHRLRDFINKLYPISNLSTAPTDVPVALWMDTLCIPVEPSAKAARRTAIQLLGKTFNEANAVLILDRELEIVESAAASFLELGLRILCSGWVKRLWTLQEAALASEAHGVDKVYFQMHDGPFLYHKYDPNRKLVRHVDSPTTEIGAEERTLLNDYGIMLELGSQIPSVHMMRNMREGWSPFQVIHSALEHRSTSKVEDIPVCIASLLGKDISMILSVEDVEQRMAKFYMLMHEIPCGVIWYNGSEKFKLSIKPFRWAPSSINAFPITHFYLRWDTGTCDSLGLHVKYGGFVFAKIEEKRCGAGEMLPQEFNIAETDEALAKLYWPPAWARLQIPLQQNLAVILRKGDENNPLTPTAAIVVIEDILRVDHESEFVCRILGYTHLLRANPNPGTPLFRGKRTELDQMWCVT